MKKVTVIWPLFITIISCPFLNAQWARKYDLNLDESPYIQPTNDGGYIIGGRSLVDNRDRDFVVLKLTSGGDIEWQRAYGGYLSERLTDIQQTKDGGYIVGGFTRSFGSGNEDVWILKLAKNGDVEWQKTYGGEGWEEAWCLQQTDEGGFIVGGRTMPSDFSACYTSIIKLSSIGNIEWQRGYTTTGAATSIMQTSDGGYISANSNWILKLASNGDIEWQSIYEGNSFSERIIQTRGGGYASVGPTYSYGAGGADFLFLKLYPNGTVEWQKTFGGNFHDQPYWLEQTADDGYILSGWTRSFGIGELFDCWLIKLAPNGEIEWQRTYGGSGEETAWRTLQTDDGGYIVSADSWSFQPGGWNFLIMKLNSQGAISPECSFIRESYATITDPCLIASFNARPSFDTDFCQGDTSIVPILTNATMAILCVEEIEVSIDIKPGSYPNSINLGSNGKIPVAIFSTPNFDATMVNATTVVLSGANVIVRGKGTLSSIEDVNGDGLPDLIVHVDTNALELSSTDTEAVLKGETFDGKKIQGTDTVRIVSE